MTAALRLSPDCEDQFKHAACAGDAWDQEADEKVPCACECHAPTEQSPAEQPAPPQNNDPLAVALDILSSLSGAVAVMETSDQIGFASALCAAVQAMATRELVQLGVAQLQQSAAVPAPGGLVIPR